jgi:hypothetical protein
MQEAETSTEQPWVVFDSPQLYRPCMQVLCCCKCLLSTKLASRPQLMLGGHLARALSLAKAACFRAWRLCSFASSSL